MSTTSEIQDAVRTALSEELPRIRDDELNDQHEELW
jgi:hypothetical protein